MLKATTEPRRGDKNVWGKCHGFVVAKRQSLREGKKKDHREIYL